MILIGTAGHIDHGKSALVQALTGIHPSRLPEEKKREMTIDLGYAYLKHPNGSLIGFIDVPGHEKLIRNMVAGATGMGTALLVVDAREGLKPQTWEHYHILRLLDVKNIIPVITKISLAEEPQISAAETALRKLLLPRSEVSAYIHKVDSVEMTGIPALREAVIKVTEESPDGDDQKPLYMPIDRCFQLKGIGTVVTGTLIQGNLEVNQEIVISSLSEPVRVRSLHNHNIPVPEVRSGQRVGVQIPGISVDSVSRGDIILDPSNSWKTGRINVSLDVLKDCRLEIKNNQTFLFHTGCIETVCRLWTDSTLRPGTNGFAQLLLEKETWFHYRQRFLIRSTSPLTTIAGGVVLDSDPEKPRRITGPERDSYGADDLSGGVDVKHYIKAGGELYYSIARLSRKFMLTREEISTACQGDQDYICDDDAGDWARAEHAAHVPGILACKSDLSALLQKETQFFQDGMMYTDLAKKLSLTVGLCKFFVDALVKQDFNPDVEEGSGKLESTKDRVYLRGLAPKLTPEEEALRDSVVGRLEIEGMQTSLYKHLKLAYRDRQAAFNRVLKILKQDGELVEISREYFVLRKYYTNMIESLEALKGKPFTISDLGKACGLSRKYSLPFAEHLDAKGLTRREGSVRTFI